MILGPGFNLFFSLTLIELTILLPVVVVNYTAGGSTVFVALLHLLAVIGHLISLITTLHILYIMVLVVLGDIVSTACASRAVHHLQS